MRKQNDSGAVSPLPVLIIVVGVLVFQALLFGGELAEKSFPTIKNEEGTTEDCDSVFGDFGCGVRNVLQSIWNFFRVIGGVIAFFFNLVTFNVPGAPWFVRLVVGSFIGSALVWSVAGLFRGN